MCIVIDCDIIFTIIILNLSTYCQTEFSFCSQFSSGPPGRFVIFFIVIFSFLSGIHMFVIILRIVEINSQCCYFVLKIISMSNIVYYDVIYVLVFSYLVVINLCFRSSFLTYRKFSNISPSNNAPLTFLQIAPPGFYSWIYFTLQILSTFISLAPPLPSTVLFQCGMPIVSISCRILQGEAMNYLQITALSWREWVFI